ncbi:hypothetical protein [Enterovirga sp.]|uniref:hypothetical protein n=1 Tax=Enterovirga sp. TaxID=2026350 RepID=UPI00262CBDD9|nr:hypothetical protein [Enterovirga sp.]MDB5590306.1 hypothetical protein [Enterovirga sp.]
MPSANSPKGTKAAPKKSGAKAAGSKTAGSKTAGAKALGPKTRGSKTAGAKAHVFLIAVKRRREALRVYAVLTVSEPVALAIVEAASAEDAAVEPVGRLSKKLAGPLKLLTGEPRLI